MSSACLHACTDCSIKARAAASLRGHVCGSNGRRALRYSIQAQEYQWALGEKKRHLSPRRLFSSCRCCNLSCASFRSACTNVTLRRRRKKHVEPQWHQLKQTECNHSHGDRVFRQYTFLLTESTSQHAPHIGDTAASGW
jgi:hypothetical protein